MKRSPSSVEKNKRRRAGPPAGTRRLLDYYDDCLLTTGYFAVAFGLLVAAVALGAGLLLLGVADGVFLRALAVEVALDGVEDAVDELRGLVGREAARDLQRLVDGDRARRLLVEELVDGHAQDVPVHDGHARDAPVLGARADALVDLFEVRERAHGEAGRELARALVHLRLAQLVPVRADEVVRPHGRAT